MSLTKLPINLGSVFVLAVAVSVAAIIQYYGWQNSHDSERYHSGEGDPQTYSPKPLQYGAAFHGASRMIYLHPYDATKIKSLLEHTLRWRPSYAPAWLNRAEFLFRENDIKGAAEALDQAESLWPTRGPLLWRIAGLRIMLNDNDKAIETLRKYVKANPAGIEQAIALVLSLEPDRDEAVTQVRQEITDKSYPSIYLDRKLTDIAVRNEDLPLAKAVWQQASESIKNNWGLVRSHYGVRWRVGTVADMLKIWKDVHGEERDMGEVFNGDFANQLSAQSLTWERPPVVGAKVDRDRREGYSGRTSLRLKFDGTENLGSNLAIQIVPIDQSRTYQLTGFWKGDEVTTRSGVLLDLVRRRGNPKVLAATKSKTGTWDWEPFEVTFETDKLTEFVELRIRRSKTKALDRLIDGDVWLDDIQIKEIEQIEEEES